MTEENVSPLRRDRILEQFFEKMYGEKIGWAYVPTKILGENRSWKKTFFEWPAQKTELVNFVIEHTAEKEVYYSPALFKRDLTNETITKDDFAGTYYVWAEFDGKLPDSEKMEGVPQPTIKLRSSTKDHEHWYWRLTFHENNPDSLEKLTKRLSYALGADLSGWDYQQVLRPPFTIHHESGKLTQILEDNGNKVSIEKFVELPDVPDHVWDVEINLNDLPVAKHVMWKYPIPKEEWELFGKQVMEVGKRSSALARVAHVCAEVGMTNEEILSVLYTKDNTWGKFGSKDGTHDLERQARLLTGLVRKVRQAHPISADGEDDDIPWMSSDQLLSLDVKVDWIVPGLVQSKGIFFVCSRSGVGKTHFTFQMACHMALGRPYLGYDIQRPLKLVVVEMEIPPEETKEEYEKVLTQFNPDEQAIIRQNLDWVATGFAVNLKLPRIRLKLIERLDQFKPDGIFWDSFQVAMGGDISSPDSLNETFDFVKKHISVERDIFNWFIHHMRKGQIGNKKPKELDDLFGGQAISAVATTVMGMWQEPGAEFIEFYPLKARYTDLTKIKPLKLKRKDPVGFEIVESIYSGISDAMVAKSNGGSFNNPSSLSDDDFGGIGV